MLRIISNNYLKVNLKNKVKLLHDRRLPEVKYREKPKNENKKLLKCKLKEDEYKEKMKLKNFGTSINPI